MIWVARLAFAAAVGLFIYLALTNAPEAADLIRNEFLLRIPGVEALDARFGPDKVTHFITFAVLALGLVAADLRVAGRIWPFAVLLLLIGVGVEYEQGRSGFREAEVGDAAANAAGLGLGLFFGLSLETVARFTGLRGRRR